MLYIYIYIHVDLYEIIYIYMYTYMYISCIHTCIHKLHICILSNQHLGTKRKKTFDERRKTSQLSSLFSAGRGPIPWAQKWGHEFGCWASYTQLFGPEFGHPFAAARHKQERSVRAATTDPLVWAHPFPMTNLVILKRRRRRRPSSTKNSCLELPRRGWLLANLQSNPLLFLHDVCVSSFNLHACSWTARVSLPLLRLMWFLFVLCCESGPF